jgi:hypothetical protein
MALLNICMRPKMMTYEGTKKHFGISIPLGKKQNMVLCKYKKTCLKDISLLPREYREPITELLFVKIPGADSIADCRLDISPMKGYPNHYRIRVGTG